MSSSLSELQERLLKKELVKRQISNEVSYLEHNPRLLQELCYLSPVRKSPFLLSASTTNEHNPRLPIFSFLFSSVFLTFPFIHRAGPNFLSLLDKFWDELLNSRGGYSSTIERGGEGGTVLPTSDRKAVKRLAKKILALLVNMGIKTPAQLKRLEEEKKQDTLLQEEKKDDDPTVDLLEKIDLDLNSDAEEDDETALRNCHVDVGFLYVNIPTVRVRKYKKHMRTHEHVDFIITSRTSITEDTYTVKRSYRDFSALKKQLEATYPTLELPKVPSKFHRRDQEASNSDSSHTDTHRTHELARLHLRSFLHSLFSAVQPAASFSHASSPSDWPPPIYAFLSDIDAQTTMTAAETNDSHRRAKAERHVWRERRRVEREVAARAMFLSRSMNEFLQIVLHKGGLTDVFRTVAEIDNIEDLPPNFQCIVEWATINFAFSLLELFSSPTSGPDTLATIKRVHSVVPYRALAAIMRWTNPLAIAKGVINLLLKRPPWPGGKSVFQQIITAGIGDEVEELDGRCREVVEELKRLVETPDVDRANDGSRTGVDVVEDAAGRIQRYVSDRERMTIIEKCPDSATLLTQILAHPRYGTPPICLTQISSARTSSVSLSAKEIYLPGSVIPELIVLLALESSKRDKLALKELAEHAATADLMKEVIGLFYGPLMDLYRTAHADRMVLLCGTFVKDLIAVSTRAVDRAVTQASGRYSESGSNLDGANDRDPFSTTSSSDFRSYFDLLNRHKAGFYQIAHALHSEPGSVLGECVRWSDGFVEWMRGGRLDLSSTCGYEEEEKQEDEKGDYWIRNLDVEELLRAVVKSRESSREVSEEHTEGSSEVFDTSFKELSELVKKDAEELERRREYKKESRRRKMEHKVRLAAGGSSVDLESGPISSDEIACSPDQPVSTDAKIEREVVESVGWGGWLFGFGKSKVSVSDSPKMQQSTANSRSQMSGSFPTDGEDFEDFEEDSEDSVCSDEETEEELIDEDDDEDNEDEDDGDEDRTVRIGAENAVGTSVKHSPSLPARPAANLQVASILNGPRDSKKGRTFPSFFSSSSSLFSDGSFSEDISHSLSLDNVVGSAFPAGDQSEKKKDEELAWKNGKISYMEHEEIRKVRGDVEDEESEDTRIESVGRRAGVSVRGTKADEGGKKKRGRKLEGVPLLEQEFQKLLQSGFLS